MNKLLQKVLRKDLHAAIPYEDLITRQKFYLYRIFVATSVFAGVSTAFQVLLNFGTDSLLSFYLFGLSAIILGLYFIVPRPSSLPTAYAISLLAGFFVIHVQAYNAGGVLNTGTIYLCAVIMTAYMLLGSRTGRYFTLLAILNVVYFYCVSEYSGRANYSLFRFDPTLIHQDALVTFILGLVLVAFQSFYLNSSKNVVIQRISEQKDELARKNNQLSHYTENLERKNRELDKFASIVSHDLKAPLRAIGNLTGWIEEDAGASMSKEVMANFELIKQRVARMESLINAILDYSRADRSDLSSEKVEVRQVIMETFEFIGAASSVKLKLPPSLPVVHSDRTRMNQIFLNLMVNAIRHNDKEEVEIKIAAERGDQGWVFSVKDNGPGIDPKYHERIFTIFQTLSRRDDFESTGVGLAIVKKLVDDQGGRIWVESALGKGADFRFFWPDERKIIGETVINAA